jgi:hypothetical protein
MVFDICVSRSPDDIVLTPEDKDLYRSLDGRISGWVGTGSFGGR